ncbi:L-threonylcarbamoyladenylate synthase [Dokdonella sp. MW10]|uniref:L-threonylcarbamoyladenylate synthase n=1 Tax=Dokdonella sp. MW10 TaxID=2992926 RepID=UPI003F7F9C36
MAPELADAVARLRQGGVVAYPTEAVWGLGCDPLDEAAVRKLFALKQRPSGLGVVLIGADVAQVMPFIGDVPAPALARAAATWPGPHTWIFPRSSRVPAWISGEHAGIALRVTAHPVAAALCRAFGSALVSTSANPHGMPPARSRADLDTLFGDTLDAIVDGPLGALERPTPIRDAMTGEFIRS